MTSTDLHLTPTPETEMARVSWVNAEPWHRLRDHVERDRSIGRSTRVAVSVTGEPYQEFWCASPSEDGVFAGMTAAFNAYAQRHAGTLYWRVEPEIDQIGNSFRAYMRLLISDKEPITPSKEEH